MNLNEVNLLTAISGANQLLAVSMMELFVEKGLITRNEAAAVFTNAANSVRDGSEDDIYAAHGEAMARLLESSASLILRRANS